MYRFIIFPSLLTFPIFYIDIINIFNYLFILALFLFGENFDKLHSYYMNAFYISLNKLIMFFEYLPV